MRYRGGRKGEFVEPVLIPFSLPNKKPRLAGLFYLAEKKHSEQGHVLHSITRTSHSLHSLYSTTHR